MGKTIGSVNVDIGASIIGLKSALAKAERALRRTSRNVAAIGNGIMSNVTLPLAAAGAAGIKLATDLEGSFGKIDTLVGDSAENIQQYQREVSSLSGKLAKSQQELADSLFAITSAGIKGSDALGLLEQAGKASAIGLGNTTEIARAAGAAMTAYGKDILPAADAVDVLTAIVREGNMEASEISGSIGKVIPIAKSLGVSFQEVGANVAAFTRLGISASESVNALKAVLSNVIKPGKKAQEALASMSMTATDLRNSIQQNGLASALQMVIEKSDGNIETLGRLFGSVEGLANVLGTAGSQAESYAQIVGNINEANGIVDEGFKKVSQSAGFQFKAALVQLENAGISLGRQLIPYALRAVRAVSGLIAKFQGLSSEAKEMAVKIGLIAAASGPALIALSAIASGLGKAFAVAKSAVAVFSGALGLLMTPIGLATAGIVAIGIAAVKNFGSAKKAIVGMVNSMIDLYNESAFVRGAVAGIKIVFEGLVTIGKTFVNTIIGGFKTIGSVMKAVWEGRFSDVSTIIEEAFKEGLDGAKRAGSEIGNNVVEEIDKAVSREKIEYISEDDVDSAIANAKQMAMGVKDAFMDLFSGGGAGGGFAADEVDNEVSLSKLRAGASAAFSPSGIRLFGGSVVKDTESLTETLFKMREALNALPIDSFAARWSNLSDHMKEFNTNLVQVIEDGLANTASAMGSALGDVASGVGSMADVGKAALGGLADMLKSIGELAIKTGIAVMGIQAAINLHPALAIAGGIALVALAKAVKNSMSDKVPKLAKGGLAFGPTTSIVGDNPGAIVDPEVISPLSKLGGMMEPLIQKAVMGVGGMGAREIHLTGGFTISGRDLKHVLDRENQRINRTGG